MARLIKCPRCQSQLDVTNVAGGTTMRCSDCGAMLRVPTGTTGQYQKVPSGTQPAVQASAPATKVGGRSTSLFKKMSGVKAPGATGRPPRGGGEDRRGAHSSGRSGNGPMIALAAAGGAVVFIVLLVLMVSSQKSKAETTKQAKEAYKRSVDEKNKQTMEEARRQAEEDDKAYQAQLAAQKAGGKAPSLKKTGAGTYEAPPTFEPGASKQKNRAADLVVDEALNREYETLASSGKVADIVREDAKWMPCIIHGMISENEVIARSSFQALSDICVKNKISSSEEGFRNPVKLEYFNSAYYRAGDYTFWTEWYQKGQNRGELSARGGKGGDRENARVVGEDPSRAKWDEIMGHLRAGGGFDDPKRPEGMAYAKVQNMGESAYPYLVKYIDNEDILLAKAACRVLNMLAGKDVPLPTEATKGQIKTQWENIVNKK